MSAWLLPDHIADVLPSEARHIEDLRRDLLDTARCYGYELVMPPLLEHLDSLLSGTGEALDLQTFKLVDQLSGRTLGLRADSTPQVARIDAHLLNRHGVTRLCYCGSVVHTRPATPHATREPIQFGAEIYGHKGEEADLEVLALAMDCLRAARVRAPRVDLADARLVKVMLSGQDISAEAQSALYRALAAKDKAELGALTQTLPKPVREGLMALTGLYGDLAVLDEAKVALAGLPGTGDVLTAMRRLAQAMPADGVSFDLADLGGYGYYTGVRFAVYAGGAPDALARGGRYDEVGAVFGRSRPAAGFSLDLKNLVRAIPVKALPGAIRAPWGQDEGLLRAVASLRGRGEIVVRVLPGHESEVDEFQCDRELIQAAGQWIVKAL